MSRIARTVVDQSIRFLGWLHKNQRIKLKAPGIAKINLGCGLTVAPGWINIDGSPNAIAANLPPQLQKISYRISGAHQYYSLETYRATLGENEFVHHDLSYGIPLDDNTADFIYSSHFIEHLDRHVARKLLADVLRVLKPNGVMRIGVPDLAIAWEMYQRGEKERMLHDYFFIDGATGYSMHHYMYDYEMMSSLLSDLGFVEIVRTQYQHGATPDLGVLDNRGEYTLFVEARKPVPALDRTS